MQTSPVLHTSPVLQTPPVLQTSSTLQTSPPRSRSLAMLAAMALAASLVAPPAGQAQVFHAVEPAGHTAAASGEAAIPMERLLSLLPPLEGRWGSPEPLPHVRQGTAGPVDTRRVVVPPDAAGPAAAPRAAPDGPMLDAPGNYGMGNLNTIYHYNDHLHEPYPARRHPWRAAGRLEFVAFDGGSYICSGALIAPSIVVTAGHCVHWGGNGDAGWNRSGRFIPAFSSGTAPYGSCDIRYWGTTSQWFDEGDILKGYDVGIAVCDKPVGSTREIGRATGWFAFCYLNCRQDIWFFTQIGYPGNYYGAREMTISQSLAHTPGPDYQYGSGMRGGSSGGPHVSNIGQIEDTSTYPGAYVERNVIFAVTSWGYIDHRWKIQGASPLSGVQNANRFRQMFNQACRFSRSLHGQRSCELL